MIEKNEDKSDNANNEITIKLIADKRKFLDERTTQVQQDIKTCFAHLVQALHAREKQLLRQAEAIYRQQISLALSNQEFLPLSVVVLNERDALEEQIRQFGRIELRGLNLISVTNLEPYKIVDYQDSETDHVNFDKSIKNEDMIAETENHNTIKILTKSNGKLSLLDETCNEDTGSSLRSDVELQRSDISYKDMSEDNKSKVCHQTDRKSCTEEEHNCCNHPEQIQQWLEQILLETEIEPTIHEVEKLPEMTKAYICTKLQVET